MPLADHLQNLASNDTVHQVTGGTVAGSVTLITQTDINTIKAVILSAVLSGLIQLLITGLKKLTLKLNGNNQNPVQIKDNKEN